MGAYARGACGEVGNTPSGGKEWELPRWRRLTRRGADGHTSRMIAANAAPAPAVK